MLSWAQEFELDLTEPKPKIPDDLKPSLVVLSVRPGDEDEVSLGRSRQLEAEVLKHLIQTDEFKTVIEPPDAARLLGPELAKTSVTCVDYACFDAAAKALRVNRAVRFTVTRNGVGSIVRVFGFDPGLNELLELQEDSGEKAEKSFLGMGGKSQAQKDREFLKKVASFVKSSLTQLATPNGRISVDNVDANATVLVDGVEAGVGSFDTVVQRGPHTVKVNVDGFLPFEKTVTVEELKTATVQITLVAKEIKVQKVAAAPSQTPVFLRPGVFIAAGGAIAVGVGIGLGQSAAGANKAIASGTTPVPMTRSQAKAAATSALLANILVGVGAAAIAGGVTWVIVTPTVAERPRVEPAESTQVNGAVIELGGTF